MVRRFKIIVSLILIIFMALSVSAFAESETSNQDMLDEILSAAPDDVANELSDVEIDAASPGSLADKLSFSSIMDMVVSAFKKAFSKQSKMLATVLTLVLFSVILKSFEDNFSGKSISTLLSTVSATAVILLAISALQNCVGIVKDALESMTVFTGACIPVLSALLISSGQVFASALFSSSVVLCSNLSNTCATYLLVPLVNIFIALGICTAVSDDFNFSEVTSYIKKFIKWCIVSFASIFTFAVSLQSFLASGADSVAKKSVKIAVDSLIPIVGSALSESVDGVFTLAGGVKTSFAIIGILVIVSIFLPVLAVTAINAAALIFCKCFAVFLGEQRLAKVTAVMADGFLMLMSIAGAAVIMTIIAYLAICLNIRAG